MNKLKTALLLTAALFSFNVAFAETGTETEADALENASFGKEAGDVVYTSITIPEAAIPGGGGTKTGDMTSKGIKLRTNNVGGKLVFNVNDGYTIQSIAIVGNSNYDEVDPSQPAIKLVAVDVDGAAYALPEQYGFPGKGTDKSVSFTLNNLNAKQSIAFTTDDSNTSGGKGHQIAINFTVTYAFGEEEPAEPVDENVLPLTQSIFKSWTTAGADAEATGDASYDAYALGTEVAPGNTVFGHSSVNYLSYANLTGYGKIVAEGTAGVQLRILMNRVENEGVLTEKFITLDSDGKAELDITGMEFVHLNAIKLAWGSPSGIVTKLQAEKVEQGEEPEEPVDENTLVLTEALFKSWTTAGADAEATGAGYYNGTLGQEAGPGATVYGNSNVYYLDYADLTGYATINIEGTPGLQLRVLLNRVADNGDLTELNPTIGEDGTAEVNVANLPFVHLNAVKIGWGSPNGKVTKIVAKKADASQPEPFFEMITEDKNVLVGDEFLVESNVDPAKYALNVVWTSSDPEVATVVNGVVTALKAGVTTISAVLDMENGPVQVIAEGEHRNSFVLTVFEPELTLANSDITLEVGQTVQVNATASPEWAGTLELSIENPEGVNVASLSGTTVTALSAGVATVKATFLALTKTFNVTVVPVSGTGSDTSIGVEFVAGQDIVGKATTIPGKYVLGNYSINALLSTAEELGSLTVKVNEGYVLTSFLMNFATPDSGKVSSQAPIRITGIYVDGGSNVLNETLDVPSDRKGALRLNLAKYGVDKIRQKVDIIFDNSNVASRHEVSASYSFKYEEPSIELGNTDTELLLGKSVAVDFSLLPAPRIDEVVIASSNEAVATVENGIVTGIAAGEATITVSYETASASFKVTVIAPDLILAADELELEVGQDAKIEVEAVPADSAHLITFATSDEAIATVDADGTVKGIAEGEATITVALLGVEKTVAVTVVPAAAGDEKVWVSLWSFDYEDADTYAEGWSGVNTGRFTLDQVEGYTEGSHALSFTPVNNGNNGVNHSWKPSDVMTATMEKNVNNYRLDFYFKMTAPNNQDGGGLSVGFDGGARFSILTPKSAANANVSVGGVVDQWGTISDQENKAEAPNSTWLHVFLTSQENGIFATITNVDRTETYVEGLKVADAPAVVNAMRIMTRRYYGQFWLDNLNISKSAYPVWKDAAILDYEDAETVAEGWAGINTGRFTLEQDENGYKEGSHALTFKPVGNGNNGVNHAFTPGDLMTTIMTKNVEGYRLDFYFKMTAPNNQDGGGVSVGFENGARLSILTPKSAANANISVGGIVDTWGTISDQENVAEAPNGQWLHVILSSVADGIFATVTDVTGENTYADNLQLADAPSIITQMRIMTRRYYGQFWLDDVRLTTLAYANWQVASQLNYEDAETAADGWAGINTGRFLVQQDEEGYTEGSHSLGFLPVGNGNNGVNHSFSLPDVMKSSMTKYIDGYKLDLYFKMTAPNNQDGGGLSIGFESGARVSVLTPKNAANANISVGGIVDTWGTISDQTNVAEAPNQTWLHIILTSKSEGIFATITNVDGTEVYADEIQVADAPSVADAMRIMTRRYYGQFRIDDVTLSVFASGETVDDPRITVEGETYTSNLVTVENPNDAENSVLYFRIDGRDTTEYVEPVRLFNSCLFEAWVEKTVEDGDEVEVLVSNVIKAQITAGEIATPNAAITKVTGTDRTITISDATPGVTVYYATDGETFDVYSEPIVISETTTFTAFAQRADVAVPEYVFVSDTLKQEFEAGVTRKLLAPTIAKNELTDSAKIVDYPELKLSDIRVAVAESSVLYGATDADVEIEVYHLSVNRKVRTDLGTFHSGETIEAVPYGYVYAKAKLEGYAESDEARLVLKAEPKLELVWEELFDTLAVHNGGTGGGFELSGEVFKGANGTSMGNVTLTGDVLGTYAVNTNFGMQTGTSWLFRNTSGYFGLYNFNSGPRGFAINNVKAKQLVRVKYNSADQRTQLHNATVSPLSTGREEYYEVTNDGSVEIWMNRYMVIEEVAVYNNPEVIAEPKFYVASVDGNTSYAGFLSGADYGFVYYQTLTTEHQDGGSVYEENIYQAPGEITSHDEQAWRHTDSIWVVNDDLTGYFKYTDSVAYTYTVYDTAWVDVDESIWWSAPTLYTEPVAFHDTTLFRIQGECADVWSDPVVVAIAPNYADSLLNAPVVTYLSSEGGSKLFEMQTFNTHIDNSYASPIYYQVNGGVKTFYDGAVSISDSNFGWMKVWTEVGEGAAKNPAHSTWRYIDSRNSYNETYFAITSDTEEWPTGKVGDLELADVATLNIEAATRSIDGRLYWHKKVHAGFNTFALPFIFNPETSVVTNAKGDALVYGQDYQLYNYAESKNAVANNSMDALFPNLAEQERNEATTATGTYLLYVINPELEGTDLIFITAENATMNYGKPSIRERARGWQVYRNNSLQPVLVEIPAYHENEAGDAFVLDQNFELAPFSSIIVTETDFQATHPTIKLSLDAPSNESTATYAVQEGETHVAGETVDVTDEAGDVVATLTFGFEGGADFNAGTANSAIDGFVAFTSGNGENGKADSGTTYIIKPVYDGHISVGVVLNANKSFYVLEDEVALADYDGIRVEEKYYGTYEFDVKAGSTYKVYCAGSKLGFYGFNYTFEKGADSIETLEFDTFENDVVYDLAGRRVETLRKGELYIRNGKRFIVK